ncbi:MAG: succinylglutamate desuccinylase/aspartoacylase family protein [Desulfosudaceae bacterium]
MATRQQVTFAFKKILTGSDLSRRRLPFMAAETGREGPSVWLTACSHGDEVAGIVIIQEIFKAIRQQDWLQKGTLYAFPLMNPVGFEARSRHIPYSQEDLNRSFPGDSRGTVGERLADLIFRAIVETDPALVIDLHTDWIRSIPYALMDRKSGSEDAAVIRRTAELARQSGLLNIQDTEALPRSLSQTLHQAGVSCLTLELGESFVVNEENITLGVKSIGNILAFLGMAAPPAMPFQYPLPPPCRGRVLTYQQRPYAATSGIIRFAAAPGEIVKPGRPLARIYNAFGKRQETMKASGHGIVLGHTDSSLAFPGKPVMAFGML